MNRMVSFIRKSLCIVLFFITIGTFSYGRILISATELYSKAAEIQQENPRFTSEEFSHLYPDWQLIKQETIQFHDLTSYKLLGIGKKTSDGYGKMKIVVVANTGQTDQWQEVWSSKEYNGDASIEVPNYIDHFLLLNPVNQQRALLVFERIHSGSSGMKDIHAIEINREGHGKGVWEDSGFDLEKKGSHIVVHDLGETHLSLENDKVKVKQIPRSEVGPADAVSASFVISKRGMILPEKNQNIYVTVGQTLTFIPKDKETKKQFDEGNIHIYTNLWNDGHHQVTTSNANLIRYGNAFEFRKEGTFQFILEYINGQYVDKTPVTFTVRVGKNQKESAKMTVHTFKAKLSNGEEIGLDIYKGKVLLIVNTASKCGLTPQYEGLEKLYDTYKDKGFTVLGFPCNQFGGQEPGTDEEISSFCSLNYQVEFPIFQKIDVNGENAHPLYQYLRQQVPKDENLDKNSKLYKHLSTNAPELLEGSNIKWNFTKFLINKDGSVIKRYAPTTAPEEIKDDIEKLLTE